jgi:chromosome segregation ATPase
MPPVPDHIDHEERRHERGEDRILETLRSLGDAQRESARQLSAQIAQVQTDVREGARSASDLAKEHVRLEERLKVAEAAGKDLEARVRPLEQMGARVAGIAAVVGVLGAGAVEIVILLLKH